MVRKHSKFLENTIVEQDASDVEVDSQFWHDVLDLYFIRNRESKGRQDDDLIFFVRDIVRHFVWSNCLALLICVIVAFMVKLSLQLTC